MVVLFKLVGGKLVMEPTEPIVQVDTDVGNINAPESRFSLVREAEHRYRNESFEKRLTAMLLTYTGGKIPSMIRVSYFQVAED